MSADEAGTPRAPSWRVSGGRAISVFVVDDSRVHRAALRSCLEAEGDIHLVGMASDAETALTLIDGMKPDVVAADVEMLGAAASAFVTEMTARALPVVVLVADPEHAARELVLGALDAGALALVPKPLLLDADTSEGLRDTVRHLAAPRGPRPEPASDAPLLAGADAVTAGLVTVISGHGGLGSALRFLATLARFPLPCPFLIHTSTPSGIEPLLAQHLMSSRHGIVIADHPDVRFADGDVVLSVGRDARCAGRRSVRVEPGRPSSAELLRSAARVHGVQATAVILEGRETEGAGGLDAFIARKAPIFVQRPDSVGAHELPCAAIAAAGDAAIVLPLEELTAAICRRRPRAAR